MINKVTLVGNLGKDPEVKHLESGSSVARIKVATNESYRDKDGNWQNLTEWHTVIAWRELAKRAEKDLKKGSLVYVEGKLRTRTYKDSTGVERIITEVESTILKSLDKRERSDAPLPSGSDSYISSTSSNTYTAPEENSFNSMSSDGPDDLPF
jgi:single-strand DNA-binding protein